MKKLSFNYMDLHFKKLCVSKSLARDHKSCELDCLSLLFFVDSKTCPEGLSLFSVVNSLFFEGNLFFCFKVNDFHIFKVSIRKGVMAMFLRVFITFWVPYFNESDRLVKVLKVSSQNYRHTTTFVSYLSLPKKYTLGSIIIATPVLSTLFIKSKFQMFFKVKSKLAIFSKGNFQVRYHRLPYR